MNLEDGDDEAIHPNQLNESGDIETTKEEKVEVVLDEEDHLPKFLLPSNGGHNL